MSEYERVLVTFRTKQDTVEKKWVSYPFGYDLDHAVSFIIDTVTVLRSGVTLSIENEFGQTLYVNPMGARADW